MAEQQLCSTCRHPRGRHVPDARPGACVQCNVECPAFMDLPSVVLSASPGLDVERLAAALDVLSEDGLEYDLMAPEEREDRSDAAERLAVAYARLSPTSVGKS